MTFYPYQYRLSSQRGPVIASNSAMQNFQPNVVGNSSRIFNVNAAPFQPGVRYVPQGQQPQVAAAYSPYASYFNHDSHSFNPVNQQQQRYRTSGPANYSSYNTVQQPQPNYNNYQHQQQQYSNSVNSYYNTTQTPSMSTIPQPQQQPQPSQQPVQASSNTEVSMSPFSQELSVKIQSARNRKAITEVQIGLEQLASDPHEYETWSFAIKSRLSYNFSSQDLEVIAWIIVEMSYLCPGSQYNFARLCKVIDDINSNFTVSTILPRLAHIVQTSLSNLTEEQINDLTYFVAECYDKTKFNGVRLSRLGQLLMDLIRVLLDLDPLTDPIIKNIVHCLKIAGRMIEDDHDPAFLNEIFDKLEFVRQNSRTISEAAKNNITQLIKLRERQWGVRHDLVTSGNTFPTLNESVGSEDNYTQYGPDGQPLTEEERAFLEENCRFLDSSGCLDDDDGLEFERYLRDQGEATAVGAAEKALEKLSM